MKWCQEHWDGLRVEVERQGLAGFVPDSGEKAAHVMKRQIAGEESVDTFDPLMGAHWAINSFIANQLGPGGFVTLIAYDGCPVCKADSVHDEACEEPGCTYTIAQFFVNAVSDQRAALARLSEPEPTPEQP